MAFLDLSRRFPRPWIISNSQYVISLVVIVVLTALLPESYRLPGLILFLVLNAVFIRRVIHIGAEVSRRYLKAAEVIRYPYHPGLLRIIVADNPSRFLREYERQLAKQQVVSDRHRSEQLGKAAAEYLQQTSTLTQEFNYERRLIRCLTELEELHEQFKGETPELKEPQECEMDADAGFEEVLSTVTDREKYTLAQRKRALKHLQAAVDTLRSELRAPKPSSSPQTEEDRLLAKLAWARPQLNGPIAIDIDKLVEAYRAMVAKGERRMKKRLYPLRQASDILDRTEARKRLRLQGASEGSPAD